MDGNKDAWEMADEEPGDGEYDDVEEPGADEYDDTDEPGVDEYDDENEPPKKSEPKCTTCGDKGIIEYGTDGFCGDDMYYDFDPCPDCKAYERGMGIEE